MLGADVTRRASQAASRMWPKCSRRTTRCGGNGRRCSTVRTPTSAVTLDLAPRRARRCRERRASATSSRTTRRASVDLASRRWLSEIAGLIMMRMPRSASPVHGGNALGTRRTWNRCRAWPGSGYPDGPPLLPNGMCDPSRDPRPSRCCSRSSTVGASAACGRGVDGRWRLNIAGASRRVGAYGLERDGNHGPGGSTNLYRTADTDADAFRHRLPSHRERRPMAVTVAALGRPGRAI
jgi:hypothetical protein